MIIFDAAGLWCLTLITACCLGSLVLSTAMSPFVSYDRLQSILNYRNVCSAEFTAALRISLIALLWVIKPPFPNSDRNDPAKQSKVGPMRQSMFDCCPAATGPVYLVAFLFSLWRDLPSYESTVTDTATAMVSVSTSQE